MHSQEIPIPTAIKNTALFIMLPSDSRLEPELHLRLLTALCADALNCGPMRSLINEREATTAALHVEHQKEVCRDPEIPRIIHLQR